MVKKEVSIYVASPLGFSEAGKDFMYAKIIPAIQEMGYKVLDPWKLTPNKTIGSVIRMPYGQERKKRWEETDIIIGKNNARAIRKSSGLVAVLDGPDVDSGTASEIGFGAALGKPVLGYRGDYRLSSENEGTIVNMQVEYFIKMNGGKIITG
jgi:nucleoside 2-deoxyribosyltransferase